MRVFVTNKNSDAIYKYLNDNSEIFIPPLTPRLNLKEYSHKIMLNAIQFWVINDNHEIGFAACYFNNGDSGIGFVTTISVKSNFRGLGLGALLLNSIVSYGSEHGFSQIQLEVFRENTSALKFYLKFGFEFLEQNDSKILLNYKFD